MDEKVEAKVRAFFEKYPRKVFEKDEIIIMPQKTPAGIYCLMDGEVRVYALSKDGVEVVINSFKPISFFPMLWVMNEFQDRYYYEAVDKVFTFCAPKKAFETFLQKEHDVVFDLLKRIYKGLEGYMMRMEFLLSRNAYLQTVTQLYLYSQRFGKKAKDNALTIRIPHRQIASQAGLTRETVTREIKKLQDKKIVSYKGATLIISDIEKLKQEIYA